MAVAVNGAAKHDTDRRLIVQYRDNLRMACQNAYKIIAYCDKRTAAGEQLTEEEERDLALARVHAAKFTRAGTLKTKS